MAYSREAENALSQSPPLMFAGVFCARFTEKKYSVCNGIIFSVHLCNRRVQAFLKVSCAKFELHSCKDLVTSLPLQSGVYQNFDFSRRRERANRMFSFQNLELFL